MIWHETADPAVIVMLTQTHESGKEKCFQYFPGSMESPVLQVNEEDEFGDGFRATVTLRAVEDDAETHSTIRRLDLAGGEKRMGVDVDVDVGADGDGDAGANTSATGNVTGDGNGEGAREDPEHSGPLSNASRTVWHLLFAGWPDFYVPEGDDQAALLALIKLSERLAKNGHGSGDYKDGTKSESESEPTGTRERSPRIVHCSAGVGRSGTFIALDYLLSEMEDGAFDPVDVRALLGSEISDGNVISFNYNKAVQMSMGNDDTNTNTNTNLLPTTTTNTSTTPTQNQNQNQNQHPPHATPPSSSTPPSTSISSSALPSDPAKSSTSTKPAANLATNTAEPLPSSPTVPTGDDAAAASADPIADTVDCLRRQRMMMVQTEAQFAFLYAVLRERMVRRLEGMFGLGG